MKKLLSSRARKLLSYTMTILLGLILSSAGCDKFDAMDPASYHGTWKWDDASFWEQVTISANELVFLNSRNGYTLTNLTWEPITSSDPDYPTGFAFTGTLTAMIGSDCPPKAVGSGNPDIGDIVVDYWYISKDGKSLMWGLWGNAGVLSSNDPFVKQ